MKNLSKETKKKIKLIAGLVLLAAFFAVGLYFTLRKTPDFEYRAADGAVTLEQYVGKGTEVVIPTELDGLPVTAIGRFCFSGCSEVTSVEIPESIRSISIYAFEDCKALTQIELPQSLTEIAAGAFMNSGLTSVEIPESVAAIREFAFKGCGELESVSLPEGLLIIEREAFAGCAKLSGVELPELMAQVGSGAFMGCASIESIVFPNFTTSPDNENDERISVEPFTFKDCTALKTVELTGETYWIDEQAFAGCTALEQVISEGGCWVGERAFSGCTSLKSFDFGGVDNGWVREYAFENCTALENVFSTRNLMIIYEGAFSGCSALKGIELGGRLVEIGDKAFDGCKSLTVYASDGSVGANYARQHGITVRELGA